MAKKKEIDMGKLLTLVIPTYNMEKLLDRCLSSLVVKDTPLFKKVEVLVVIDGAKDRSSEIAHEYQNRYPAIFRVIDKENGNYGSCVNRGLKEATGKYIKVLDADDCFNTEAFAQYLSIIENQEADLIITSGTNVNEQNEPMLKWRFDYEPNKIHPIEDLKHVWIHEVTHKTALLRKIDYVQTEGISYTDEEWVFYPMSEVKTFFTLNTDLYQYTVGREGQTMNPAVWSRSMKNEIQVSKGFFAYLANNTDLGRATGYYKSKMETRMQGFYYRALVECCLYNNHELIDFDKWIKTNYIQWYLSADSYCTQDGKFRFVKQWRAHDYGIWGICCFKVYRWYLNIRGLKNKLMK